MSYNNVETISSLGQKVAADQRVANHAAAIAGALMAIAIVGAVLSAHYGVSSFDNTILGMGIGSGVIASIGMAKMLSGIYKEKKLEQMHNNWNFYGTIMVPKNWTGD